MTTYKDFENSSSLAEELLPTRLRSVASPATREYDVLSQLQRYDAGMLPGTVRASDGGDDGIGIKITDKGIEIIAQ